MVNNIPDVEVGEVLHFHTEEEHWMRVGSGTSKHDPRIPEPIFMRILGGYGDPYSTSLRSYLNQSPGYWHTTKECPNAT